MDHFPDLLADIINDNDDSGEDIEMIKRFIIEEEWVASQSQRTRRRGSIPGHITIDRYRVQGHERLYGDYFGEVPVYPDHIFRRRFRMSHRLFCRIQTAVEAHDPYFVQRSDAIGVIGLSSLQKITAAFRMLAYGAPADSVDKYVRIGESTAIESLRKFVKGVGAVFGAEYTRSPNAIDIARLLSVNEQRGFPGMLGSIDCMHWRWKNCPSAWQGQYSGHFRVPTIILEAVASQDLRIWQGNFGLPGSLNDLNVLDRSHIFAELAEGHAPPVNYTINGHNYMMGYYLADGIYPKWSTFVKTISCPQGPKKKYFATKQESARKDVERAFGVLQARFAIVRGPARYWDKKTIGEIMQACIIMHNMIIEDEEDANDNDFDAFDTIPPISLARERITPLLEFMERHRSVRDNETHSQLQSDLVEHMWQQYTDR